MKSALWKKADKALRNLYGNVLPIEIADRYFSEYAELKNTDQIIYFELLSRMASQGNPAGGHILINGGIGASFTAFIMGASEINPLRPHYYCPDCHKIRFVEGVHCGWDLPAEKCSCGRDLIRDGHNLPFETLRPMICKTAHYDISVSQNLYQAAQELIPSYFQDNIVVTLTGKQNGVRTYAILDAECSNLTNGQEIPFEEYYDYFKQYPTITLIRNEELDACGQLAEETGIPFENVPFTDQKVFDAFLEGRTEGIPEFKTDFSKTMIAESAPASIYDLIQTAGLCHGVGVWEGNGRALVKAGRPIGSLIAYRDDVFHYIQGKRKHENSQGTGYACHVMENVRRGVYAGNGMSAEIRQQLSELGAEDWVIESFEKIEYLFPKAHGILHVKHAMIYMWYKINYPEAFGKIIPTEI